MFARTRPPGDWNDLSAVSGSEFEDIDAKLAEAVDGAGGGPYEPTEAISIAGAGLEVTTSFSSTGDTAIRSAVIETGGIIMSGGSILVGAGVDGLTVSVGDFALTHNATIGGTLAVTGQVQFDGNIVANGIFIGDLGGFHALACTAGGGFGGTGSGQFDGNLNTNGAFSAIQDSRFFNGLRIDGILNTKSTIQPEDEIILSGRGRMRYRVATSTISGPFMSATYAADNCDVVMIGGDGVLLGDIEWRVSDDGAAGNGTRMTLSRALDTGAHNVTVRRDSDSTVICTLDGANTFACELIRHAGSWKLLYLDRKGAVL